MIFLKDSCNDLYSLTNRRLSELSGRKKKKVYRFISLADLKKVFVSSAGYIRCLEPRNGCFLYNGNYYAQERINSQGKPYLIIGCKTFMGAAYRKIKKALKLK